LGRIEVLDVRSQELVEDCSNYAFEHAIVRYLLVTYYSIFLSLRYSARPGKRGCDLSSTYRYFNFNIYTYYLLDGRHVLIYRIRDNVSVIISLLITAVCTKYIFNMSNNLMMIGVSSSTLCVHVCNARLAIYLWRSTENFTQ
jgi:hypothetical protein